MSDLLQNELLFRGQHRKYGQKVRVGDGKKLPSIWVYGGILQGSGDFSIIYGGTKMDDPSLCNLDKWPVYTDTLGQYIGARDKNGTRVFTDDVCRFQAYIGDTLYHIGTVKMVGFRYSIVQYRNGRIWNEYPIRHLDLKKMEVIGNIHDSPELQEVLV